MQRLEPYVGKLARTVLRGRGGSNAVLLPDISHDWLVTNIPMDKVILRKWLKSGFVWKNQWFPTEAGTPQGGIISPTLANMTLDGMERKLRERFGEPGSWKAKKFRVNLVRYADDVVIAGTSKEILEEAKSLIEEFLKERGLSLSPEKTKIVHIEEGFDFLGWNARKYNGTLLIKPAKKSVQAFLRKIRGIIKANRQAKQENLIGLLNPVIRGWANYHSSQVAKETFQKVDKVTWKQLWSWACRRHPNKGTKWIKDRYWRQETFEKKVIVHGKVQVKQYDRDWVFAAAMKDDDGKEKVVRLVKASDTPIRRHVKIKAEANPYDPKWEEYFEERTAREMYNDLEERRKLRTLWWMQEGICPVCEEKITKDTWWNIHHVFPRSLGGTEILTNLKLLHPNCHRQVHSRGRSELLAA